MRTDQKPFDDVRVRQAFRLIVDRKEMLDQIFGGHGQIGNDVFSILDKSYQKDLPQREQDIDQAKSLLKAAGADNLTVDLVTTPNAPGMVQAAQVFATQAKKAGVNVNVVQQTTTDYFANSYLKVPFSQDYWQTGTYMFTAGQALIASAPFNFTMFNDPEYNSLYTQALAQLDQAKRADLIHQMARIDYDRGGYIIPYFFPVIDAASMKVGGITENANGYSPSGNDFADFWLT
jgi:peptide/nickel transport system substrate-binding protein